MCEYSLEYSMTVKLLTEHHLEFLSFKGGYACSSESTNLSKYHIVGNHMLRLFYIWFRGGTLNGFLDFKPFMK